MIIPCRAEPVVGSAALWSLLQQREAGPLRVIVSMNGPDATNSILDPELHRQVLDRGWQLLMVRREKPGKAGALNAAEALMTQGHRVYLDADVRLSEFALAKLCDAMDSRAEPCLALIRPEYQGIRSRICRSYFALWSAMPYCRRWVPGNGVFAVNEAGRERWGSFPPIHSDDTFVRLQFDESDVVVVDGCTVRVPAPGRFGELVRARARWTTGSRIARRIASGVSGRTRRRWAGTVTQVLRRPELLRHVPATGMVVVSSWVVCIARSPQGRTESWRPAGPGTAR